MPDIDVFADGVRNALHALATSVAGALPDADLGNPLAALDTDESTKPLTPSG